MNNGMDLAMSNVILLQHCDASEETKDNHNGHIKMTLVRSEVQPTEEKIIGRYIS